MFNCHSPPFLFTRIENDVYCIFCHVIAGIITKKEGKTKVLEANAESEEARTDWITSIKAVFKDPLSPRFSGSPKAPKASEASETSETSKEKKANPDMKPAEKEKDCQCIVA